MTTPRTAKITRIRLSQISDQATLRIKKKTVSGKKSYLNPNKKRLSAAVILKFNKLPKPPFSAKAEGFSDTIEASSTPPKISQSIRSNDQTFLESEPNISNMAINTISNIKTSFQIAR